MSFQTALSGLNAASTDLDVTGNNIANASTVGFKRSRTEFADVYAVTAQGTAGTATGSGVRVTNIAPSMNQGNIEFTENSLDIAISGNGFFTLDDNGSRVFSRAGQFHVDSNGFIVNSQGHNLLGVDATGTPRSPLTISNAFNNPQATGTTTAGVQALFNLDSRETNLFTANAADPAFTSSPVTAGVGDYHSTTALTVYDTLGNALPMTLYMRRVDPTTVAAGGHPAPVDPVNNNAWETFVVADGRTLVDSFVMEFDNTGGLAAVDGVAGSTGFTMPGFAPTIGGVATGGAIITTPIDFAGTTQFGSPFSVNSLTQDGFTTGQLTGIDIADDGTIFGRFSNGQTSTMGVIELGNFPNNQGLQPLGDNLWAESVDSGQPIIGNPGSSNLGLIQSGALESSNVDITQELVNMIIAQRNFQANSQVISVSDQVTQTIINIR